MSKKNKNKRQGVVFSTNTDYDYDLDDEQELDTLPANQQHLIVLLDRKQRKGKTVTLVTGFVGETEDLKDLGKTLKSKCGVGGAVKNNEIMIQGDFAVKVIDILVKLNYKVKRSGGK